MGRSPQRSGDTVQQRKGHAGNNGEGGDLRREPVVTLSKNHPRSTKSTPAGSALAPAESPNILTSHNYLQSDTSLLFHITTLSTHGLCSMWVWYRERVHFHFTISRSFWLKPGVSHDHCRSSSVPAPLHEFSHAGVRLGEAPNPGPAAQERDRVAEERNARQRRINEAGDSVPGSQESITRGVQNLQLTGTPATQTAPPAPAPPPMPNSRRPTQTRAREQQEYFRCAECGSDPEAFKGASDHNFMLRMVQKHGGQHSRKCCPAAPTRP